MHKQNLMAYRQLWSTKNNQYALVRIDDGYAILDKTCKRFLLLQVEGCIAQEIIDRMLAAQVEVLDDKACAIH